VALISAPGPRVGSQPGQVLEHAEVWSRVNARLERALLEVDRLVAWAFDRELTEDECRTARRVCGTLATMLADLGMRPAVDLVRQISAAFASGTAQPSGAQSLSTLVDDARTLLRLVGADALVLRDDAALLVVVGPSSADVDALCYLACAAGMRVVHLDDWMPVDADPGCIVVVPEEQDATTDRRLVRAISEHFPLRPIVAALRTGDPDRRLAIAPFVELTLVGARPQHVLAEARALFARDAAAAGIGFFGDDGAALLPALAAGGVCTEAFASVERLDAAVRSRRVHVVVIGATVARSLRLALTAMIRKDPGTAHAKITVLLEHPDAATSAEAMRAGANAVLPAGSPQDLVVSTCRAQLRTALYEEHRSSPALEDTLHSRQGAAVLIERMLVNAFRTRGTVTVGVLSCEAGPEGQDGFSAIGEPLAREFRREDVIARWNDGTYVVALSGVGRRTGVKRFENALANLGVGAGCRVGVAEFPYDGRSLEELVGAAEAVLERARCEGGPRVVSSDWQSAADNGPDVLVLDGDPTLRALVVGLVERAGLKATQLDDGVSALEFLTGERRRALPRAIVMELDLMGIDGLQLLRRLRDAGVMKQIRVLVLTSRIRERELLEALTLGASDVVTKPLSPALLMHRLRRVMQS
jgi:CheY-like chemotaxis protein